MAEPSYIVENGRPISEDTEKRLAHKIAGNTYDTKNLLTQIENNTRNVEIYAEQVDLNTDDLETLVNDSNYWLSRIDGFVGFNNIGKDASGRTRVSQLTTLLDGKVVNGHTDLIFQSVGTGTGTTANAKHTMSVTSGQYKIFSSRRYLAYLAGKSEVIEPTFDNFAPQANVEKTLGYFSSNAVAPYDTTYDGFGLKSANGTITFWVKRSGTTVVETDITAWTGYSSLGVYQTLSTWDNFTVCYMDFLWLGGAIVRVFLKTGSSFVLAHMYHYPGTEQDTMISTPCKPLRFEIRSTGGSGTFRYICSQVSTEGSVDEAGIIRSVHTTHTPITATSIGTKYPIKAIRKSATYRCVPVSIQDFALFVSSANDRALYTLEINPTLSAPLTYSSVANSSIEEASGNGTITVSSTGTIIAAGYLTQDSILPTGLLKTNFLAFMGIDINDAPDQYVLCITPITGSIDTHGAISYKEF